MSMVETWASQTFGDVRGGWISVNGARLSRPLGAIIIMGKFSTLLRASGLAVTVAMPAAAQDADTVIATVGGTEITLGHVITLKNRLPEQYQQVPPEQLYSGIVEQLVSQVALSQLPEVTETKQMTLLLENEKFAYLATSAIEGVQSQDIAKEDVEAAYAAEFAGFIGEQEFNASHILVETEEEALDLIKMIEDGADFAELAVEKSTGPSGPNGGQLGWFGLGAMVPEFEEAVVAMENEAVSAPIQTQFGWHVIRRNDSRTTSAPTLDQVRGDIEAGLRGEMVRKFIDDAVAATTVEYTETEIDPALINRADLLDD